MPDEAGGGGPVDARLEVSLGWLSGQRPAMEALLRELVEVS